MKPEILIAQAEADGLRLFADGDSITVRGPEAVRRKWIPRIRENKAAILATLPERWIVTVDPDGSMVLVGRAEPQGEVIDEFDSSIVEIPDQADPTMVDRWLCIRRLNEIQLSFAGRVRRENERIAP